MDVLEWSEEVDDSAFSGDLEREGLTRKLSTFLSRQNYNRLSVKNSEPSTSASQSSRPRLLFISSLPNVSSRYMRQAFQISLLEFARTHGPKSSPLIVVIPDSGQQGAAEESWSRRKGGDGGGDAAWDLRSIAGPEVLAHPGVATVELVIDQTHMPIIVSRC